MADIAADLELSVRAQNCLRANGVRTLDDFLRLSEHRVMQWRNAGRRTWGEIREVQADLRRAADSSIPAVNAAAPTIKPLISRVILASAAPSMAPTIMAISKPPNSASTFNGSSLPPAWR